MNPEIVCIGQAVVDCITRDWEEQPHRKNVYRAGQIILSVGGDAVNESIHFSSLGHPVRLVCGLGEDVAGRIILEEVSRRGIDTGFVTVSRQLCTPVANLMVRKDGSRSSVNSPATMLESYTPPREALAGAKIVSLASLFRAPLDRKEVITDLIRTAKQEGTLVCADTKLPTYRDIHLKDLAGVLPLIDYIFPNENEAAYYTGEQDLAAMAETIRAMGVRNVIVKAGPEGCVVRGEDGAFAMPAKPVNAVDSSGAGDSFVAGFLSALLRGGNLHDCCEHGTARAAECVQHIGATQYL